MNLEKIEKQRAKVILQFAIPSIIAMVLTSMINIVDGFFIGNYVGTKGLAAVNLGLPIVYLFLGIGLMMGVGGIVIAGRLLGAKEIEDANQVFRQTIVFCMIVTLLLTAVMFFSLNRISVLFHTDTETERYFVQYYGILIFELPLMVLVSVFGMFIRGEGNPLFVMVTNIISVALNCVLDYVFAGPLSLGVAGVAYASLLAAVVVVLLNIHYFLKQAKVFHFGRYEYRAEILRDTIFNGSSEFIGELSMCISMMAYNSVILHYAGVDGLAAFTIIGYVSYVFSMIIIGFGQGIVPIISFTFGAEKMDLAKNVRNTTMGMVACCAVFIFIVMSFTGKWYVGLFSNSNKVIGLVIPGLKIQMSSFLFAGLNTIASFYFTAVGRAKESAVISASRGLVVLLIAIALLPMIFGMNGVWLVSLTTETVTLMFSILYMRKDRVGDQYVTE